MTTRNNSAPVIDYSDNFAVYTWTGLLNGDVGDAVLCAGWAIASVEWEGTAGSGFAGATEVSNNAGSPGSDEPSGTPTQWSAVSGLAAAAAGQVQDAVGMHWAAQIRPHITAGDGTTSMTFRALLVR